ncbi:MAG: hypothetical protein ACI9BO_000131 [Zhongshania sp.]|jgi:hypothetical protein
MRYYKISYGIPGLLRMLAIVLLLQVLSQAAHAEEEGYRVGDPQLCLGCHDAQGIKPVAGL